MYIHFNSLYTLYCPHSQAVEKYYDSDSFEVTSLNKFTFPDSQGMNYLQVHFERKLPGGWMLSQAGRSTKVSIYNVI